MKCHECGGDYEKKHGRLKLTDKWMGDYDVREVSYLECKLCHDRLFPPETIEALERRREEILDNWIKSQPLESFVTAGDTAALLGISRQALHKHRRIRRGFIYQTRFGGNVVYLRRSVELFKKTGDGRFLLHGPLQAVTSSSNVKYVVLSRTAVPAKSRFRDKEGQTPTSAFELLEGMPKEEFYHA